MLDTQGLIDLAIVGLLYLVPTFIAGLRNHPSYKAIIALNILAGWTGVGWIAAFVWSLTGRREPETVSCPHCAEQILPEAKICRHCHLSVNPPLRIVA